MHGAQPAACSARAVEDAWADEGLSFSWTLDNFGLVRLVEYAAEPAGAGLSTMT